MIDLERDLQVAEAMAADLKAYLLSNNLYWTLSVRGSKSHLFPKGTLGGLFLRLHRLDALSNQLSPEQVQRLRQAQEEAETHLDQWAIQAEKRAVREIKARLGLWRAYLEEVLDKPRAYIAEYPSQAEGRTALVFLFDFAGRAVDGQGLRSQLEKLDRNLTKQANDSDFVWDEALQPAYPREAFWWLYVLPKIPESTTS